MTSTLDNSNQNEAVFSRSVLRLGEFHWHLLRASHDKDERSSARGGSLAGIFEEIINSGREIIGDEIYWWVFTKESNVGELKEQSTLALVAAEILKHNSELLRSKKPETLGELCQILRQFADDHSAQIEILYQFVLWLAARDRLAPTILWAYRVWGSTRKADRNFGFNPSEPEPSSGTIKTSALIVIGLISEGRPTASRAEDELLSEMRESGIFDEESGDSQIRIAESRLVGRASAIAFYDCAEYFDFIRHSLRNILVDIHKFTEQADFANDDAFWRAFIQKVTQTPKAEPQLWDFKQTLTMWHVDKEPERNAAKVAFCEDIASFANSRGGVLIVGVTDKREIVGIGSGRELENKLKFAADVLSKHIEYPQEIFRLRQIVVPGKDATGKVCLVVVTSQAGQAVAVHDDAGHYTFPVRRESGLTRVSRGEILRAKGTVRSDNHSFLGELYKFVYPMAKSTPARPSWPQESGVYTASSSEAIPAFPSELSGHRFEAGKDFWRKPFSEKGTIRVFQGGGWQGITQFPATMNGCSSGIFMIRWRSSHGDIPVESSLHSYNAVVAVDAKPAQGFGYMSGTNCEQPMFKFPDEPIHHGATLVDVYYELRFWQAAP